MTIKELVPYNVTFKYDEAQKITDFIESLKHECGGSFIGGIPISTGSIWRSARLTTKLHLTEEEALMLGLSANVKIEKYWR